MATAAFVIPDIQNTWTADSGNTNFQRIQKTGIQLAGAGASVAVGVGSGVILGASGASGGLPLIVVAPGVIAINAGGNLLIQEVQLMLYEELGIH